MPYRLDTFNLCSQKARSRERNNNLLYKEMKLRFSQNDFKQIK